MIIVESSRPDTLITAVDSIINRSNRFNGIDLNFYFKFSPYESMSKKDYFLDRCDIDIIADLFSAAKNEKVFVNEPDLRKEPLQAYEEFVRSEVLMDMGLLRLIEQPNILTRKIGLSEMAKNGSYKAIYENLLN